MLKTMLVQKPERLNWNGQEWSAKLCNRALCQRKGGAALNVGLEAGNVSWTAQETWQWYDQTCGATVGDELKADNVGGTAQEAGGEDRTPSGCRASGQWQRQNPSGGQSGICRISLETDKVGGTTQETNDESGVHYRSLVAGNLSRIPVTGQQYWRPAEPGKHEAAETQPQVN